MLRKMLIPKIREILRKRSMMKFIFVKLLAYIGHAANLLKIDLPTESFWNKFQKMAVLKMVF